MKAIYQLNPEDVFSHFNTSPSGLNKEVIPALQAKYGRNTLQEAKRKSKLSIFINQFRDVMILILGVAAGISFFVGEHTDGFVILAIVLGNAAIGYSQEYNAEESMRMLRKLTAQNALVIRNNHPAKINAADLVPGDVIILEAGDIVPADARLIQVSSFRTDEASLTGESQSIEKKVNALEAGHLIPADQHNMIFKGTIVSNGSAKAVVSATGMNTELGKIAGLMEVVAHQTPLQKRLAVFSKQLAAAVIFICLIVFGVGLWRGVPAFEMFLTALSLAVAALPEALPAVITIALAEGARRLVKQNALMRNLPAVETLGSVTYICSDKTGTLTQNMMTVEKVYATAGNENLMHVAMALNNDVRFSEKNELLGDSTETALVKYALLKGYSKHELEHQFPLLEKLPFDSIRMRMSTLHKHGDQWIVFVKGAPIKIVEQLSDTYKEDVGDWLDQNRQWASAGLRVLFFAYKIFDREPVEVKPDLENDLDFLGMTAMIDPPREGVLDALDQCKSAGIKAVMITGDQPLTASAIAGRLHIIGEDRPELLKTGKELNQLDEGGYSSIAKNTFVYARVTPEQKLNIVKALQHNGEFVAMTGDGVNDAPSLKQANIGVAMGITGTDVSKEAADIILLDDNFATIVKAVKEGRRIYENIKKFILYVLSCNLGEILTILIAPLLGFAIPLLPTHILWINLVTDGLPGLALVAETAEKDIMSRPPRPPKESLFSGGMIPRILVTGTLMTASALFVQWWVATNGYDVRTQQTAVFTTLCFVQLGNAISVRSVSHSGLLSRFFKNKKMWWAIILTVILQLLIINLPYLNSLLKTMPLNWYIWQIVLATTFACLMIIELFKFLIASYHKLKK